MNYEIQDIINEFFEASQDGFFVYDSHPPRQVYVSPAVEKMYGVAREVFYENPAYWSEQIHADDKSAALKALEEWVTGSSDATYDVVHRIVRPDNEIRWVHVRGIWVSRDSSGNHRAAGIATDITNRKLAEDAFYRSELHRQQLIAERDRISQDLHDGVLQSLYGVGLALEAAKVLLRDDPDRALGQIQRTGVELNALIGEIRAFLGGLAPSLLGTKELASALEELAVSFRGEQHHDIALAIDAAAVSSIPNEYGTDVLNIVKEAVSNAVRHAEADHIRLSVTRIRDGIRVEVDDDGRGFDMGIEHPGLGLTNIARRARRIGADCSIQSTPGRGTRVCIDIKGADA